MIARLRLLSVDTGAFHARADRRDPARERTGRFYRSWHGGLFTTELVFAETMSLLTRRFSGTVAATLGRAVQASPAIRIERAAAIAATGEPPGQWPGGTRPRGRCGSRRAGRSSRASLAVPSRVTRGLARGGPRA